VGLCARGYMVMRSYHHAGKAMAGATTLPMLFFFFFFLELAQAVLRRAQISLICAPQLTSVGTTLATPNTAVLCASATRVSATLCYRRRLGPQAHHPRRGP
jgi:hypothetical protein